MKTEELENQRSDRIVLPRFAVSATGRHCKRATCKMHTYTHIRTYHFFPHTLTPARTLLFSVSKKDYNRQRLIYLSLNYEANSSKINEGQ